MTQLYPLAILLLNYNKQEIFTEILVSSSPILHQNTRAREQSYCRNTTLTSFHRFEHSFQKYFQGYAKKRLIFFLISY